MPFADIRIEPSVSPRSEISVLPSASLPSGVAIFCVVIPEFNPSVSITARASLFAAENSKSAFVPVSSDVTYSLWFVASKEAFTPIPESLICFTKSSIVVDSSTDKDFSFPLHFKLILVLPPV